MHCSVRPMTIAFPMIFTFWKRVYSFSSSYCCNSKNIQQICQPFRKFHVLVALFIAVRLMIRTWIRMFWIVHFSSEVCFAPLRVVIFDQNVSFPILDRFAHLKGNFNRFDSHFMNYQMILFFIFAFAYIFWCNFLSVQIRAELSRCTSGCSWTKMC